MSPHLADEAPDSPSATHKATPSRLTLTGAPSSSEHAFVLYEAAYERALRDAV